MCEFFSVISDGKGNVKHFDIKDIVEMMSIGNPKDYSWNSHTSICQFHGINSKTEDLWNKWEYDPYKQILGVDSLVTTDDSPKVKEYLVKLFKSKNLDYLRNLYNRNSGDRNSGDRNSGNSNSGDWNSGNSNSGDWNSGDRNSGDRNSGNSNSGDWNSGNWNSGDGVINGFCSKQLYALFNEPCTKLEYEKISEISSSWFNICDFIYASNMTEQEKIDNPSHVITGGFLRVKDYKEAWKECPKSELEKIKKLKNFNAKIFKEITGIE